MPIAKITKLKSFLVRFFFRFFVFLCDFFSFRFFLLIKNVQIYMDLFCFCFVFSVCVLFNMYTYMYNNNTFNVV